jgi:hypothetical protein
MAGVSLSEISVHGPLEDRLRGLSQSELQELQKLIARRLETADATVNSPVSAKTGSASTPPSRKPPVSASSPKAVWQEREPECKEDPYPHTQVLDGGLVGGFRLLAASRRGKSHAHGGTYREDAFAMTTGSAPAPWWFLAVSDGAGSHSLSRVGSNLATKEAARLVQKYAFRGETPKETVQRAAKGALQALQREAERRGRQLADFSCTLLLLLWKHDEDEVAVTFQAGDGFIARVGRDGSLELLAEADGEKVAGATHFLGSSFVAQTWDRRFREHSPVDTAGFLVATDGVADDLVPLDANGPILCGEFPKVLAAEQPSQGLLDLLAYEKRGSFDDRTLALAWRTWGL